MRYPMPFRYAEPMAAARSRDPVLAKIRLMWVLTVWVLRNSRAAICGLDSSRARGSYGVDAAFMSVELHERGIHAVSSGPGGPG